MRTPASSVFAAAGLAALVCPAGEAAAQAGPAATDTAVASAQGPVQPGGRYPSVFAPYVEQRGIEAVHYQGENVLSTEAELTWQVSRRWSLLAFAGYGTADGGDSRIFADSGAIVSGGAGFRYLIARKLGLHVGIDAAVGPQGEVFYLQFGHAWALGMD